MHHRAELVAVERRVADRIVARPQRAAHPPSLPREAQHRLLFVVHLAGGDDAPPVLLAAHQRGDLCHLLDLFRADLPEAALQGGDQQVFFIGDRLALETMRQRVGEAVLRAEALSLPASLTGHDFRHRARS